MSTIKRAWRAVTGKASDAVHTVEDTASAVVHKVGDVGASAAHTVSDAASTVASTASTAASTTVSATKAVVTSKWTIGSIIALITGVIGFFSGNGSIPLPIPAPTAPPAVVVEAPKPAEPAPVKPVEPPKAEIKWVLVDKATSKECVKTVSKVQSMEWRKFVGEESGNVIQKQVPVTKEVVQWKCPVTVVAPSPVVTPKKDSAAVAPAPAATKPVESQGLMIGFQGLGGIFDGAAFRSYAVAKGYVPVIATSWKKDEAVNEALTILKKNKGPYALYGFSLGAETAAELVEEIGKTGMAKPKFVITIGASSVVPMKNLFEGVDKVEHVFHQGTKHDVDGKYIDAPHSGANNIQQQVTAAAKAGQ